MNAHVMVAFLGCALWVTLKNVLKRRPAIAPTPSVSGVDNPKPLSPMKAVAILSTLQSADIAPPPPTAEKSDCAASPREDTEQPLEAAVQADAKALNNAGPELSWRKIVIGKREVRK